MDPLYIEVLKQWLFFFGLMTMLLMPAIRFRKIALKHNKNGWWYCLIGFGVSGILLLVLRLIGFALTHSMPLKPYRDYIAFVVLAFCLGGAFLAVELLKQNMKNKEVS